MRYCHECGSEIAEIDVFCPYCGITQNSVAVEDESVSDRTIAVSDLELTELVKNSEQSKNAAAVDISDVLNDPQPPLEINLQSDEPDDQQKITENEDASPLNITSENQVMNTDSVDIPAQFISEAENSEKEVSADEFQEDSNSESEADYAAPEPQTPSVLQPEEARRAENIYNPPLSSESGGSVSVAPRLYVDEKKETADSQTPDSDNLLEIDEEVSEKYDPSGEEESENSVSAGDIDFSSTIPYIPKNIESPVEKVDEKVSLKAESPEESEKAIDIPDEPIVLEQEVNTQFDSVRIMHDHESNMDTLIKKVENVVSNPPVAKIEEKREEERRGTTYTNQNIGGSDTDGSRKSAKLKPLAEGTVLNNRYEIVRKIGGGGMGAVYLATDKNLGGILRAVKEMVQSYIEESAQEKAVSDFKRESMLLTSLDHPSIPTIYDYFYDEKEGRFYLVMKYISGGDLASRLRSANEGRLDEELVTDWAAQVADVLDYLHNRQPPIVYRDLKPSNIMIDGNSLRVMLIDFGIARWVNKEEKGVTAVGTMGYAPPELFSGNVEPRSDIYSLGSTMFHLLTGADPQSNPLLIFDFQKHPRPRQINPRLSDQMEKILMRAVEYNADNRFRTAAEMREVLREHLLNLKSGLASFGIAKAPIAVSLADQNVFCGFCGQKIVATDMFCAYCGSKQPLAQQGVNSAEYVSPMTTARLVIIGTSELDSPAYNLEKDDNLLGRRDPLSNIFPEVDLSKFDPQTKISRRHARIWRKDGQYLIEDLGSSNGTVVMRVVGDSFRLTPHQPHPLTNGEKVKVGDTTLHFVVG